MIHVIADNITSPLGLTTEDNLRRVSAGDSALCRHEDMWRLPEPFVASLFTEEQWAELRVEGLSRFESLVYASVREALTHTSEDVLTARTCLVLSTTKANVERISDEGYDDAMPDEAAKRISRKLGLREKPIVVCNACISGVSAQVLAKRLMDVGYYDYVIVSGCDVQSRFIVSGFQSLKATSDSECRPFDIERLGLNLGEAASTIVFSAKQGGASHWHLQAAAVSNDAVHITNPSPKGIGCAAVLGDVLAGWDKERLALLNVHGTATMYNDQMESKAIESAGLSAVPTNALKGYYGHTMGAAGVMETVFSLHSVDHGLIVGTRGFEELGVSGKVNISKEAQHVEEGDVIKMISGFGGCNGAVLYTKKPQAAAVQSAENEAKAQSAESENQMQSAEKEGKVPYRTTHTVRITADSIILDGKTVETEGSGKSLLTCAYKKYVGDYPKFYKMDVLGKVGFVATELLLHKEGRERFQECNDRAVVLMNHSSSLCADMEYQESISSEEEFYPSPSVFVYTLPNIVTGEIAIRNKYQGETSFYILGEKDKLQMQQIIEASFLAPHTQSMLAGWIDANGKDSFEAEISIMEKENY